MEFGVLGPLAVRDGGPVAIPRGKPTAVLLALLLHRNEVVSSERLIDDVWGETAPRTANKTLQLYVSQLREVLPSGVLVTQPAGEHPLREHLLALLMLALYRCGSQADALEAYRIGRRRLLDQLGIEPTSELRTLEQQILRHEPSLAPPPKRRMHLVGGSRRARISLAGVAALVAAAVAAGLVFGLGSGAGRRLADANTAALVGPDGRIATEIPVGDSPAHAAIGGGFLWTSNERDGTVSRVDRADRSIETVPVGRRH